MLSLPAPPLDKIGRYKIVAKIGQGGMSHVYKGYDETLDRHVAVKTISADGGDDPNLVKRFEREAQSVASLNHPHIITVYDFGQEHGKLFMAMELLEGVDLKEALALKRLRTLGEKLSVMQQICEGLGYAHEHGIVHRDLKPANIHLLPDAQVKIMDFGLARSTGSDMTRTGLVMGTPHYMSPEQVRGEHVDLRSDVFALGAVFYEMLTGKKPFDADTMHSVMYKVIQEEPKPVRELVPDLPFVLQQILEKALAKRPAERFQNAAELGEFLELASDAIDSGRGNEPLPGLVPPTHRSPVPGPAPAGAPDPPVRGPRPVPAAAAPSSPRPRPDGRSGSGQSRARSGPRLEPARSRRPLYLGGALLAAVLFAVSAYLLRDRRGSDAAGPARGSAQVDAMMQQLVETQVETARKKLAAGDFQEAATRAEKALKYDPNQAEAKQILKSAGDALARIDTALAGAAGARTGPPTEDAQAAYWTLLEVAPDRSEARELAPAFDSVMRGRAEEARRLMAEAQKKAEQAQATLREEFRAGASLGRDADAAFKAGRFGTAALDFMRARDRFARALR